MIVAGGVSSSIDAAAASARAGSNFAFQNAALTETPFYQAYASVAPNAGDWPNLVTRVGRLMTGTGENQPYDWSPQIQALAMPTLIIVGDADSVILEQTVELFRLLGGGVIGDFGPLPNVQLAVIPGTAHSALLTRSELLSATINPFLEAPMPEVA